MRFRRNKLYLHQVADMPVCLPLSMLFMYRLTRKELRIIEETKRDGAELQEQERQAGVKPKRSGLKSLLVFVLIFFLLAFGIKLVISIFQ